MRTHEQVQAVRRVANGAAARTLAVVVLAGSLAAPAAAAELRLDAAPARQGLAPFLEVLADPTSTLDIAEIASPALAGRFVPNDSRMVLHEGRARSVWARVRIAKAQSPDDWFIEVGWPFLGRVAIHMPESAADGKVTWRALEADLAQKPGLLARLTPAALAGQPVYLRLRFEHPFWARPQICTLAGCQRAAELEFLWFGAFAGIVLLVLALHLVLFAVFRERDHLLYALCLAGAAGYVLVGTGMVTRLFTPLSFAGHFGFAVATLAVTSVFSALFARSFLQVERTSRFSNRLLLTYAAAGAGLLLLPLFPVGLAGRIYGTAFSILTLLAAVVPTVLCWRKGGWPVRLYAMGWIATGLGACVLIIPQAQAEGHHVLQIAIALNAVFMTGALVQRLRVNVTGRQQAEVAVERREQLLRTLAEASGLLLGAQEWEKVMPRCLESLADALQVKRGFLFRNERDDNARLWGRPTHAWLAPEERANPAAAASAERSLPLDDEALGPAAARMAAGEVMAGSLRDFSPGERGVFTAAAIDAIIIAPVFVAKQWWGTVGVANRQRDGAWSEAEIDALRSFARLCGVAIERAAVEAGVRESENKMRTLFENARVALFRVRITDGHIIEHNRVTAGMFGFPDREEFARDFSTIPNWADPAARERMWAELRANQGVVDNFETEFLRRDGTRMWVRFSARAFPDLGYIDGVGQDITKEKKHLAELQDSENRYRAIFDTAPTAMIIYDERGRILLANREFSKLTGYTSAEIAAGFEWYRLVAGATLERMQTYQRMRQVDPASVPRSYEIVMSDRHGGKHEGIVVVEAIPGTGQCVAGFLDLTERKQAEEQMLRADKMAALGQIIAGIAHEITNPNNFVYFNLPILRRYLDAIRPLLERCRAEDGELQLLNMPLEAFVEDAYRLVDNMQHGSARITEIVSELRDYISSQSFDAKRPQDIGHVVNHAMVLVGKQVQKMVKNVKVELPPGLPPMMMNEGKIEQVLINLVVNAAQAADKPDSWVRIFARVDPARPDWVQTIVEDNGCGMTEEVQMRAFDPFFTTKGRETGTGLGLAISLKIVREHGGELRCESTPGQGTRFFVELPACPGAAP